ncbi:metallophosphoesterase family protein [Pelomyxa schiedti]|nr:metallophosphoesterase family protein [Pelomyxa schiedti]
MWARVVVAVACWAALVVSLHFDDATRTFKVVQFTDLHFYNDFDDALTLEVQKIVLDAEAPVGLVALSGDILAGSSINNNTYGRNHATAEWEKMAQPMIDRGLNWAITFGNHDDDGPLTREQMMDIDTSLQGSLSQFGPNDLPGVSNYWLPVYKDSTEKEISAVMYFLAVSDGGCENVTTGDGCINTDQINWYKSISKQLRGNGWPIFSLMFIHIPTPEFMDAWNTEICYGTKNEDVCCPSYNTGLYDALVEMGDVKVLAVGHDHSNDYCCAYASSPDMNLCYGRKSGFGYYNPPFPEQHGGRVFEMEVDTTGAVNYATWIRDDLSEKKVQEAHFPEGPGQTVCV